MAGKGKVANLADRRTRRYSRRRTHSVHSEWIEAGSDRNMLQYKRRRIDCYRFAPALHLIPV